MSLDVYLELEVEPVGVTGSGIFVRENGQTREITRVEWDERYPARDPVVVAPDDDNHTVFHANITHNLNTMAEAAGIYKALWRPEEVNIETAEQLIAPLRTGLAWLQTEPEHFKQFNPQNGWGDYNGLVEFIADYLRACTRYPAAKVRAWR